MTTYTYAQLEQLWINAGGSKATAPIAAAIAEAESSGNSSATNPTDNNGTQTSWGLWQISNGTHAQPVPGILDPSVNARAAVAKYDASGWEPWGTYTSGAYSAYLSNSTPPDPNVPAATLTAVTSTTARPCLIGPFFGTCVVSKSQARALIGGLMMTAGALILLPGLIILVAAGFRSSGAAGAVAGAAQPLARVPVYGRAVRRLT